MILKKILSLQLKIFSRNINTLSQKIADQKSIWHKHIVDILVKLFYRKVDKLIAQSQGMKKDLVKNYAIDEARISVIPNPLSSRIEKVARKLDFNSVEKEDYLLCVGRLESAKAFHYAIEAFSIVAKHHPTIRLKIVGQGSLDDTKIYTKETIITVSFIKIFLFSLKDFYKFLCNCFQIMIILLH